jgi:hypothetical protein
MFWLSGCSQQEKVARQRIEGKVLLDGAPLDHGSVRFEPDGAKVGISAGAVIDNGSFVINVDKGLPTGKYKVSISSPEGGSTEPKMPDPNTPPPRERIPAKYNTETELAINVDGTIVNEIVFELTSK